MSEKITKTWLKKQEKAFLSDRANRVAMDAVTSVGVMESAKRPDAFRTDLHAFSVSLPQTGITNQKRSGRCWMFAALNTMRFRIVKKLDLKDFELSQAYTMFWDKLEKANYFLENILKTLDEPTNGRLMQWLLTAPVQDGGQWDMVCSLIDKYGVVPKACMPETFSSSESMQMNFAVTEKLREDACRLRAAYRSGEGEEKLRAMKDGMMETVYGMLCVCLGVPPKTVDLEVRSKDDQFIRDPGLTPQEFFRKYVDMDLSEYISLINAPTADKPYWHSYSVKFLGNVIEGRRVKYVNLPSEELKKAAIAQLQDGEPVWFGCDVGKSSIRDGGAMSLELYDKGSLFDTSFGMNKAERLDYGHSLMTHAMVFQGVNLDEDGRPNRWRVENSWGKEPGKDGYYVMTDAWFDEYLYQVVVNKKYLPEEVLKAFAEKPIMLEPWDPMGSLA